MVRDPAERGEDGEEGRPGERDKCRRNKKRKREGRRKERSVRQERGGVEGGGCILPHSLLSEGFWTGLGAAEREGRWRVEERRGTEPRGGAGVAFVCFPRFKASLEK